MSARPDTRILVLCAGVLAGAYAALVGPDPAPAARSAPRPTVMITRAPRAITTVRNGLISFKVANARRVECSIDGRVFRRCASPLTYKRLALGAHTVVVRAKSRLRTVAASRRFVVVAAPREALVPWPTLVSPFVPPASTRSEVAAPQAPAAYSVPAGATQVETSAGLRAVLANGVQQDVVLADGTYDAAEYFSNTDGDRIYAAHLGQAVLTAGVSIGANSGPPGGLIQGLAFDVGANSRVLHGAIVHVWGAARDAQVLDVTFNGHGIVGSGIIVRQPEGVVIRRVIAKGFTDYGMLVDANDRNLTLARPATVEDVSVSSVSRTSPRSSNGQAEACLWLGNTVVLRRARVRDCAWMGLWTGTASSGSLHEHLDVDATPVGVYLEHFTSNSTFQHMRIGARVTTGVNCEWADPAWGRRPACVDNVVQDSTIESHLVGVYLDEGTTRTVVRRVRFRNQTWAAIGNYRGIDNAFADNDYSRLSNGAAAVSTAHLPNG